MSFAHLPRTLKLLDAWWSFTHGIQHARTEIFAYAARDNRVDPTANVSIHGVSRGNYIMLVFDGEYNGLLSERAAIAPQNITVTAGGLELLRGNLLD